MITLYYLLINLNQQRSRCLLLPWLIMTFVDVFFSLLIAFAELALPVRLSYIIFFIKFFILLFVFFLPFFWQSNFNTSGCTVPAISMVVTLLVCFITVCFNYLFDCGVILFFKLSFFLYNRSIVGYVFMDNIFIILKTLSIYRKLKLALSMILVDQVVHMRYDHLHLNNSNNNLWVMN